MLPEVGVLVMVNTFLAANTIYSVVDLVAKWAFGKCSGKSVLELAALDQLPDTLLQFLLVFDPVGKVGDAVLKVILAIIGKPLGSAEEDRLCFNYARAVNLSSVA